MDEKIQAQIAEAKANGYTDEQIDAFLNPKPVERLDEKTDESGKPVSPFVDRSEEAVAIGQYGLGKAAELGAELYAGKKILQAAGRAFRGPQGVAAVQPGQSPNSIAPTRTPVTPVTPTSAPLEPGGQKLTDFTQQRGAYEKPNMMQRGMDIAQKMRQIAAEKVIAPAASAATAAAPYVRGATAVGGMVMPGNAGQNYGAQFPQTGPMRGSEINPQTGRPWTPQELAQYTQLYR
jgi:hypothetical protein